MTAADARWSRVRRLLVVRLDNLGDLLMTTPAIAAARASVPGVHVTLLGSRAGAAAAAHVDGIDEAIAFDAPWVKPPQADDAAEVGEAERAMVERLRAGRFDAAVIFTVCTQSALPAALLCRLAGIPLRLAHSRENAYALLSHRVRETDRVGPGMRHEVRRQLDLVASVGWRIADERLRWRVGDADRDRLQAVLRDAGLRPGERYVVVHPGASAPSRRWPAERFGRVADALVHAAGVRIVFAGGDAERPLVDAARAAMHVTSVDPVDLCGRLDLGSLGALIDGAALLIANNSGPAHLAAALGTPSVVLYALTNPQHVPWQAPARVLNHDVPCRDCLASVCPMPQRACLDGVTPQQAVQAALELIESTRTARAQPSAALEPRHLRSTPA